MLQENSTGFLQDRQNELMQRLNISFPQIGENWWQINRDIHQDLEAVIVVIIEGERNQRVQFFWDNLGNNPGLLGIPL
jgi:hypothetical protein